MTTGTQTTVRHSVPVTGIEDYKGQATIKVTPWFKSDYGLTIYLRDEQASVAETLKRGDVVIVERGGLKKGKAEATAKDWDYHWNFVSIGAVAQSQAAGVPPASPARASSASSPAGASVTQGAPPAPAQQVRFPQADPTRVSIERQTSLNRATDLWIALIGKGETVDLGNLEINILATADIFERYLAQGVPPKEGEPF